MKPNKLVFIAFIVVALVQLIVPWQMISKQPTFAETGAEFKFKIDSKFKWDNNRAGASIRGKYIWLKFEEDYIKIGDSKEWEQNQGVYVQFTRDSSGFAKIEMVAKQNLKQHRLGEGQGLGRQEGFHLAHLEYPFREYYIKDTNRNDIEEILKNSLNDSLKVNYLSINIRANQFHMNDLVIDGISFKEMMRKIQKSNP